MVKHQPLTKYLHFHKITGLTLFFSGEKIEKKKKKKKKKFLLPTDPFCFSMLVEAELFFTHYKLLLCRGQEKHGNSF